MQLMPIPGAVGYFATADGRIVSTRRGGLDEIAQRWRKNYLRANVRFGMGRASLRVVPVHRLVLMAWKGQPDDPAMDGRHLDGDTANNCSDNLSWGTRKENIADCCAHGRHVSVRRDERIGPRKLLSSDVQTLRAALPLDVPQLAGRLGITVAYCRAVRAGRARSDVPTMGV